MESAMATADVLNKLNTVIVNIGSLTIFHESELYKELRDGTYIEDLEIERLMEVKTLINNLNIKTNILSNHISNTVPITGVLPNDKAMILRELDKAIAEFTEQELKVYRDKVWHL